MTNNNARTRDHADLEIESPHEKETDDGPYEVVICPEGGVEKDHAELLRRTLINERFYDHVVSVRPVSDGGSGRVSEEDRRNDD